MFTFFRNFPWYQDPRSRIRRTNTIDNALVYVLYNRTRKVLGWDDIFLYYGLPQRVSISNENMVHCLLMLAKAFCPIRGCYELVTLPVGKPSRWPPWYEQPNEMRLSKTSSRSFFMLVISFFGSDQCASVLALAGSLAMRHMSSWICFRSPSLALTRTCLRFLTIYDLNSGNICYIFHRREPHIVDFRPFGI